MSYIHGLYLIYVSWTLKFMNGVSLSVISESAVDFGTMPHVKIFFIVEKRVDMWIKLVSKEGRNLKLKQYFHWTLYNC